MNDDQRRFYAERLDALWGRYLQFVSFVISLTGGTLLILLVKLVELKVEKAVMVTVPALLWGALVTSAVLAVYAIVWRAMAQRNMEYGDLAPFETIGEYLGGGRAQHAVTDVHRFEARERGLIKSVYKAAPWITSVGLLAAWAMIGTHLASLL